MTPQKREKKKPQHALSADACGLCGFLGVTDPITHGLLAKHHLPGIFLDNGPLAFVGGLATSVPRLFRYGLLPRLKAWVQWPL